LTAVRALRRGLGDNPFLPLVSGAKAKSEMFNFPLKLAGVGDWPSDTSSSALSSSSSLNLTISGVSLVLAISRLDNGLRNGVETLNERQCQDGILVLHLVQMLGVLEQNTSTVVWHELGLLSSLPLGQ
jgi:hypothetical protein